MIEVLFNTDTVEEFFRRGRHIAKLADQGLPIPQTNTRSFEDPLDLLTVLTAERFILFRTVRNQPGSVSTIGEGSTEAKAWQAAADFLSARALKAP